MHPTIRLHNLTHLSYFKLESRVLERFLHLTTSEESEVAFGGVGGAVGFG